MFDEVNLYVRTINSISKKIPHTAVHRRRFE